MSDNIKIVIEIPTEMFQEIRDAELISLEALHTSINAIKNGKPLSEEYNKIKEEIEEEIHNSLSRESNGLHRALCIVNKHIGQGRK